MEVRDRRSRIVVFGTAEAPQLPIRLETGPLSVDVVDGVARGLRWHTVEVIRAISCPIRDESWATYPSQFPEERIETSGDGFTFERRWAVADRTLSCRLVLVGRADGFFRASAELTAHRDFPTNRAGFIVLHPIAWLPGSPLIARRPDGSTASVAFPKMVSPGQPVFDIQGLVYSVQGIEVTISFKGETFEMEDQRNWSDASYKTYCRPLSRPTPYLIAAGETVRQEIEIHVSGSVVKPTGESTSLGAGGLRLDPTGETVPAISLAIDGTSLPGPDESVIAGLVAPRILQLRVRPETANPVIEATRALICDPNQEIELEIVIAEGRQIDECLEEIAKQCSNLSIRVARVIALPEAYLRSYQPAGPWPGGPTPRDTSIAARRWFPGAQIGGGVLTNFAELNRCRPDTSVCDYITHGATAIVHAADDRSVVECIEGLSQVFASARALAGIREYRLGVVSIGMRSNPYGSRVVPNPDQLRLPMVGIDPRQRGLFAAAWAIAAVAATERHGVSSIALAAPVGPLGIIYRRAAWPQPIYDDGGSAVVYPLFHVVRALSQIAGKPRLRIQGVPRGVVGVAAASHLGSVALLANISGEPQDVILPDRARVWRLDEETFATAISDPDWLRGGEPEHCSVVALSAFSFAFVDLPSPPEIAG
jgi:D-apionolactonase